MEGFLSKRGKRIGSRVKRYMRLQGSFLSNHHAPSEPPTWRVNINDASISCNLQKHRIQLELYANKLELFADTVADCQLWYDALTTALQQQQQQQQQQQIQIQHAAKENQQPKLLNLQSDNAQAPLARTSDLGKNFKVVKPKPSASREQSNASDEPHPSEQPLVVNGQPYEETPASMIFKQFNFPLK